MSIVLGWLMLLFYLRSVPAPLPLGSLASGFDFALIAATAGLVLFGLGAVTIAPALIGRFWSSKLVSDAIRRSTRDYVTYFLILPVAMVASLIGLRWKWLFSPLTFAGFVASAVLVRSRFELWASGQSVSKADLWIEWSKSAVLTLLWFLLMQFTIVIFCSRTMADASWPQMIAVLSASDVALAFAHWWLYTRWSEIQPVVWYSLFLIIVISNLSYFGGVSLRTLGIGGGIPVSLAMRSPLKDLKGCLILDLSNEVVVSPVATASDCRNKAPVTVESQTYGTVGRYSRSDVLRFSKF